MIKGVRESIEREGLLSREGLHLVALSGGADSVALLHLLLEMGFRVEAAHCNFHLRGEESNRDEQFVADLCERLQVPLHRAHFDTRDYAALHHVSIEMAARDLRYHYFQQLADDIGAETICVAHHRDDAVETFLMNLLRGSGIHGLTGMRQRNGRVVRPLLAVSRADIEAYLKSIGECFVTDSTNLQTDVLRNKIRLQLIPMLKQLQPKAVENIGQTADFMLEIEQLFDEQYALQRSQLLSDDGRMLPIANLRNICFPENFLHEWLDPMGFNTSQIRQLLMLVGRFSGRTFESSTHQLLLDRDAIIVEPFQNLPPSMKVPEEGRYHYWGNIAFKFAKSNNVTISKSKYLATVDAAKVEFPLTVRPVQDGDRFVPFGMTGHRLLSDFLTDRKLTLFEKRRQLVITDRHDEILWVVGWRTDNRCRVSPQTTTVLLMEYLGQPSGE